MRRDGPPFRADHVGSLLRPPELLEARREHQAGRLGAGELHRIEDVAIRDAVRRQEDVGLQSVTDGEFRRGSWHMDFLYQVGGVTKVADNLAIQFRNEQGTLEFTPSALRVESALKLEKCIFGEHFEYLRSVARVTPKLTLPSPSMMHYRGGRAAIDPGVYPDLDEFWRDLSRVYADEIDALAERGCTYLQLDDTSLAYLNDPAQREYVNRIGGDGDRQHLTYIRALNAALARRPPQLTVCTHMCRGNYR
ncbi:MAG: 5-methyltetrahydropteroyltriglutamate--homocysteine S-methyltransferase, partial [Bryobacteraceae bacterium]